MVAPVGAQTLADPVLAPGAARLSGGAVFHDWRERFDVDPEELGKYRAAVQSAWVDFATTPEAKDLLNSHLDFLRSIGASDIIDRDAAREGADRPLGAEILRATQSHERR